MIVQLSGTLVQKEPGHCVVDVGGVGYGVQVSLTTFSQLPDAGKTLTLPIYTHVREDQLVLFGFATTKERMMFRKLISISGVGPKLALAVLSGLSPDDLASAVSASDSARLSNIPGIGKKTAERMIIELRGIIPDGVEGSGGSGGTAELRNDTISALLNLGYTRGAAESALAKAKLEEGATLEETIRTTLKELCKA